MKGARTRWRGAGRDWALGAQRGAAAPFASRRSRWGHGAVQCPGAEGRRRPPHLGRRGASGLRGRSRPESRACPQPRPRPAPSNESPRTEGLSAHSTRSPTPRRRPHDTAPRAPIARPSPRVPRAVVGFRTQLAAPLSGTLCPAPGVQVPLGPQPPAILWPPRGVSKSSLSTLSQCRVHAPPGRVAGVFGELC